MFEVVPEREAKPLLEFYASRSGDDGVALPYATDARHPRYVVFQVPDLYPGVHVV